MRFAKLSALGLVLTVIGAGAVCHHAAYTALALGAIMKDMPKMIATFKCSDRESAEEEGKVGICAACLHMAGYLGLLLAGVLAGLSKAM
jgi:hypothetical protein